MVFPQTPLNILVEILIDGVWTNITSYVYRRDQIQIRRGRADEASVAEASTCLLTLNNRDGRFSPRNPTSPYFGKIGRNTQIRVQLPDLTANKIRFHGEVSSWPQRWDTTGKDVYTQIECAGIMRRLNQQKPISVPAYKQYLISTNPNAYWPLDEGTNATKGKSATPFNTAEMFRYGDLGKTKFGEGDLGEFLPAGLSMNGSASGVAIKGEVNSLAVITDTVLDFVFRCATLDQTLSVTLTQNNDDVYTLELRADGTNNDLRLRFTDASAGTTTNLGDTAPLTIYTDGNLHHIRLSLVESGSDVAWTIYVDGVSAATGTRSTAAVGGMFRVAFTMTAVSSNPIALGHVVLWNTNGNGDDPPAIATVVSKLNANDGENAATRMSRLCTDAGVTFTLIGTASDTTPMGRQADQKTLLEHLRECEAADRGVLFEPRGSFGLTYKTRTNHYNQTVELTLNYANKVFAEVPEPIDDDRFTKNDVTLNRENGGSARAIKSTGPLSTQNPPSGVGLYQTSETVNVYRDELLSGLANWIMNQGTIDLSRFPVITLNLARTVFTGDATLTQDANDIDVGQHLHITNLPAWLPPEDVHLLAQGFTETLANFEWQISINCIPGILYEPAKFSASAPGTDRFDAQGSTLAAAITSGQTAFNVIARETPWTTTDTPFDIMVGGERMTVTASAALPALIGVGATAAGDNASLNPGLPASVASGDRVYIFASIRNVAASVNLPTNWTSLLNFANIRVMYRDYDGVWTMPTVTFTGGAAGDTTLAQSAAWRGILSDVIQSTSNTNGSAQDIAVPNADFTAFTNGQADILLFVGWKQDDWTSTVMADLNNGGRSFIVTEIEELSSILGNDAAQVWAYIAEGPSQYDADSFVVTGGAAAVSKATGMFLQTAQNRFTVTRSVNGIVKSHVAGTEVKLFKTPTFAL